MNAGNIIHVLDMWAPIIVVATAGALVGAFSMRWYGKISPQDKLALLGEDILAARHALTHYDGGDVADMLALSRDAIGLSLKRVRVILVPTLIAALPALILAWWFNLQVNLSEISFAPGVHPRWLFSGHIAYWISLGVSALVVKNVYGIR